MALQLFVRGEEILRQFGGDVAALPTPAGFDDAASALTQWSAQYRDIARLRGKNERLLPIGRAMLEWLNQGDVLRPWLQSGTRELEIDGLDDEDPLVGALLGAPWVLLADAAGHLALSDKHHFTIVRRVAPAGTPRPSAYRDIAMLFMAAAPEGQHELDYEAEEAAVLEATRELSGAGEQLVQVTVEESGELPVLASRNVREGTFDVLHLSCHGEIAKKENGPSVPILHF